MQTPGLSDAALRRLHVTTTLIIAGAVAGVAYVYERTRRRWWEEIDPLAAPRSRLKRAGSAYRGQRDNATMLVDAIAELMEISRTFAGDAARKPRSG